MNEAHKNHTQHTKKDEHKHKEKLLNKKKYIVELWNSNKGKWRQLDKQ